MMINTVSEHDLAMSFRGAIRSALMEPNPILRESLLSSLSLSTEGNSELDEIFLSETAPAQASAEVHIVEPEVAEHAASARSLAHFLNRVASAVNEIAKQMLQAQRRAPQLLVTATAPGSFEITLQAPDDIQRGDFHYEYTEHDVEMPDTAESIALKNVAALMTAASSEDLEEDDSPISAQLAAMPVKARQDILAISKELQRAKWNLHGKVIQRRHVPLKLQFTQSGATRLFNALDSLPEQPDSETMQGYLDGYRRSEGILYVKRNVGDAKAILISVSDPALIQKIAEYSINSRQKYQIVFLSYKKLNVIGDVINTSRSLKEITPSEELEQGSFDEAMQSDSHDSARR
ncbi:MAG: hypothetical protein ABF966_09265 [Bifidobacterium psychraerophilum]|uniref:hypothetical protein n=1 Tax=Bifidobacterium psychraerophilum TaxID=218140 RepID=UPI0039EADF57